MCRWGKGSIKRFKAENRHQICWKEYFGSRVKGVAQGPVDRDVATVIRGGSKGLNGDGDQQTDVRDLNPTQDPRWEIDSGKEGWERPEYRPGSGGQTRGMAVGVMTNGRARGLRSSVHVVC